jgi:hypothetical protein
VKKPTEDRVAGAIGSERVPGQKKLSSTEILTLLSVYIQVEAQKTDTQGARGEEGDGVHLKRD